MADADEVIVDLDTPSENGEDTPAEETPEKDPESPEGETPETPPADVAQLQATNKKLFERAKKAEAEVKALKGPKPPAEAKPSSPVDVDERILLANGMAPALMKELKKVAKINESGLIEAQTDPIFVAVKEKFEKEQKQKNASMGASRGSGSPAPKKSANTPGLSREEHQKMAKEAL